MSEFFIGEIKMFAGNFAIRSFALCDGQLLSISQNNALFALLGIFYGGDGRTTFGLPDLRGRIPIHQGTGPGLSNRRVGEKSGKENVTVTANQLPAHTHPFQASGDGGNASNPAGEVLANGPSIKMFIEDSFDATLATTSVTSTGGNQSHTNMMPVLGINFIIALTGVFPSRN